jgi:hypothetical protein
VFFLLEQDKPRARALALDIFAAEVAMNAATKKLAEENRDKLEYVHAAIQAQGKLLEGVPRLSAAMEQLGDVVGKLDDTLSELGRQQTEHAADIAFMQGAIGPAGDRRSVPDRRTPQRGGGRRATDRGPASDHHEPRGDPPQGGDA